MLSTAESATLPLNPHVRGLGPSATVAINERCDELRRQGRQIYKLGLGQSPFPIPAPVVEALRANAWRKDYLPVCGLAALRDAVAEYHRRANGVARSDDDVLIGPGSKELMFLLQVVYDGELIIPTPAWVSYAPQARILGRKVHFLHAPAETQWRLDPDQLHHLCRSHDHRPRILVLNYPSNPTGMTYSPDELQGLAQAARQHGIVLLSDEIYGELHHQGHHHSVAHYYPEGTIISSGLSKWCGAGGWRLGTFTFPSEMRWLLHAMAAVASETYTSTSAPIQHAAMRAFEGGAEIEDYLNHSRRILAALGRRIAHRLQQAGAALPCPQGAFYLFPDFGPRHEQLALRGIHDNVTLCERLLEETGVAILPGMRFGSHPQELTARLAYVDFDGARALAASAQIPLTELLDDAFLGEYCGNVLEAVERLCDWLAGA
jgi:aspartate aminotransferase